jgi:hypothetical protein
MSMTFGMESPSHRAHAPMREPVRYMVIIDSGGSAVARLFLNSLEMVSEIDAAVEEVGSMTAGLIPKVGALGMEWDAALTGHSTAERSTARIFTLTV